MRRHVLSVGRRRRHLGVTVRRIEALRGGLRIIIEMDQVVRDAGMLRQPPRDRLEDRGPLGLLGVGLVVQVGGGVERDRVGDLRLIVVAILGRDLLLRIAERTDALDVAELVVIGVRADSILDHRIAIPNADGSVARNSQAGQ